MDATDVVVECASSPLVSWPEPTPGDFEDSICGEESVVALLRTTTTLGEKKRRAPRRRGFWGAAERWHRHPSGAEKHSSGVYEAGDILGKVKELASTDENARFVLLALSSSGPLFRGSSAKIIEELAASLGELAQVDSAWKIYEHLVARQSEWPDIGGRNLVIALTSHLPALVASAGGTALLKRCVSDNRGGGSYMSDCVAASVAMRADLLCRSLGGKELLDCAIRKGRHACVALAVVRSSACLKAFGAESTGATLLRIASEFEGGKAVYVTRLRELPDVVRARLCRQAKEAALV